MTQAEKIFSMFTENNVITRIEISKKLGISKHRINHAVSGLLKSKKLRSKTVSNNYYFSRSKAELDKIKSNSDRLYEHIRDNGTQWLAHLKKHFNWQDTQVCDAFMLSDKRVHRRKVDNRVEYYTGEQDKPDYSSLFITKRGHENFKKYKDQSFKIDCPILQSISEILGMASTSADPETFNRKFRYRLERMPAEYWLENVDIDYFIKDIDLTVMPAKVGSNGGESHGLVDRGDSRVWAL